MQLPALRDDMDREHLEQVLLSAGYAFVTARIQAVIEQQKELLLTDLDAAKTAEVRGVVRGLRLALASPGQMLQEYKAKRQ